MPGDLGVAATWEGVATPPRTMQVFGSGCLTSDAVGSVARSGPVVKSEDPQEFYQI